MSKVSPAAPFASISGKIFGQKSKTSLRVLNGKEHFYNYVNKPAEWSEKQINTRLSFGAAAFFARLVRKNPEAEDFYKLQLRKQKKYHRLDNFMASVISEAMKTDETVYSAALSAYQEHLALRTKHAEHEQAMARHILNANSIWESYLKKNL